MTRSLSIVSVAALIALSAAPADARPRHVTDKPQSSAAVRARQAKVEAFSARMNRLDALMGKPTTATARSRSADAAH